MVRSPFETVNGRTRVLSATIVTPGVETASNPVDSTETVYVSGASDRNVKCPDASEVLVEVCDGLVAVTLAPASGLPVVASTTVPVSVPVVPARTKVPWPSNEIIMRTAISDALKRSFSMLCSSKYETRRMRDNAVARRRKLPSAVRRPFFRAPLNPLPILKEAPRLASPCLVALARGLEFATGGRLPALQREQTLRACFPAYQIHRR